MNQPTNQPMNQSKHARAERIYRWVVRAYPAAHRRTFGRQMLQTFQDYYRDAVETGEESTLRFWLAVAGDEARSLVREHGTALGATARTVFRERTVPMKAVLPIGVTSVGVLLLLGLRVWLSPALLSAPHGGVAASNSVAGLAILVLVYALVAFGIVRVVRGATSGATSGGDPERTPALGRSALLGALVGVCALGAIALDTLVDSDSLIGGGAWAVVAVAAMLGWGLAALTAARASGSWRLGVVAAVWSGMVSAMIGAVAEVASTLLVLPQLAQRELSNPDYLYWHQPDVQSYAIASAFALGMMGLILAPVAAGLVGAVASWLGRNPGGLALASR